MGIIATDMREMRPSAKRTIFEPTALIPATNVQDAIAAVEANVLVVAGNLLPTPTSVTTATYTASATDRVLEVNFAGNVAITLGPTSARGGFDLQIKDISGGLAAGPYTITVTPDAADTGGIDGMTNLVIAVDFETFILRPRSLVWRVGV